MAVETMSMRSDSASALILTSGASGRVRALFSMRELKRLFTIIHSLVLFLLLPFRAVLWPPRKVRATPQQIVVKKRSISVSPPLVPAAVVDEEVAVRRELAIRRVLEDEGGGDGSCRVRDYSLFTTKRGDTLFTQSWSPLSLTHK